MLVAGIVVASACERPQNDTQISKSGDDESHYKFSNCMNCHYSAGEGEGWFSVAGTANGDFEQASVELYSGPNGTGSLVHSLEFDRLANFFTTEYIDVTKGLYVGVRSATGNIEYMEGQITNGGCNQCHGETTEQLTIDY